MEAIPGPDFPTGGIICGRQGILDGYRTGRGKITLRARASIDEESKPHQIIITEVPLPANPQPHARSNRRTGQGRAHQRRSARSAMNRAPATASRCGWCCDIKRDADAASGAEPALPVFAAAKDGQHHPFWPWSMAGRGRCRSSRCSAEFLRHRVQVIRRRTEYLLREAKRRTHVLGGQLIAISSLDEVIQICRSAPSRAEAKERLQNLAVAAAVLERASGRRSLRGPAKGNRRSRELTDMTEAQADAVVRLQLGQLAALERDEIFKEYNGLRAQILGWETLLSNDRNIRAVIRKDLEELRDKYGDERRTHISDTPMGQLSYEDLLEEEVNVVTLSHNGYIKRLSLNTYRSQHRGGKGVSGRRAAGRRFRRAFLRRFDSCLFVVLHQPRPDLLAQRLQHPRAGPHQPRPGNCQRLVAETRRKDHQRHPGPRV